MFDNKYAEALSSACKIIGACWVTYQAYNITYFFYLRFLRRSTIRRYRDNGSAWALVTGATDGIGRGFAQELCEHGFNVVIHGRNEQKLEAERQKLLKQWPSIQVRTLRIDAAKEAGSPEVIQRAVDELKDLKLKVLINNVGGTVGMAAFVRLHERTIDECRTFIDVNLRFPTELTKALLPQLRKNAPALILNMGSTTSDIGLPYLSVYSGSKGYNKAWSQSLTAEMKADGVDVEVICMMISTVATDYTPRELSPFTPNARRLAQSAIRVVGSGNAFLYPHWGHAVQATMLSCLPILIVERAALNAGRSELQREVDEAKQQ